MHLYPIPRSVLQTGEGCVVPTTLTVSGAPADLIGSVPGLSASETDHGWIRLALDATGPRESGDEAYRLSVGNDGVRIVARIATGLRWGLATLVQLMRQHPQQLPGLVIDDAPAFAERGFMLDVARDRIPTMATLFDLVDRMASLKLNHLQLYHEHSFAYVGHETVWRNSDAITPAETRELDAHCRRRGVQLCANQNTFGHYERWLRHPAYAPLGIIEGPWLKPEWGDAYMEPTTLDPQNPGSLALVEDLLRQQLPLCSSPYANIGGDEPWELGLGRSETACKQLGKGAIYSGFLSKVVRAAERMGKRPQYWCDPHPNEDDGLPRDLVALVWEYDEPNTFAPRLAAHAQVGREIWVAPGTSTWNSLTSRTWNRRANLARAAREGLAHGARGFLTTDWGDQGSRQQWPLHLFGMADGAQAAWSGSERFDDEAPGLHLFGDAALGRWLAAFGDADRPISDGSDPEGGGRRYNATAIFEESLRHFLVPPRGSRQAWERIAARLANLESALPVSDGLINRECRHALAWARYSAERTIARCGPEPRHRESEFRRLACPLIAEYRKLWLQRSRYGGLEDSCAWWKRLVV